MNKKQRKFVFTKQFSKLESTLRQRKTEMQNRGYDIARIGILKHDCRRVYKKDKAELLVYKERLKNIIDMNGEAPQFEENGPVSKLLQ